MAIPRERRSIDAHRDEPESKLLIVLALVAALVSASGCSPGGGGGGGGGGASGSSSGDPLLGEQWHLLNQGQRGGVPGEDADVLPAWQSGYGGTGVLIAVVDDGLEIGHEDLVANVAPGLSFSYADGSSDPTPRFAGDSHGTCVSGVAAARGANGLGGSGAAPLASLACFNLLAQDVQGNDALLVDAMTRHGALVSISNNSWGPTIVDAGGNPIPVLRSMSDVWYDAIDAGVTTGRGGRGIVYLFASGNEAAYGDDTNYSAVTTHPAVVVVGAVGDDGRRAPYSTPGATVWIAAPSQGINASHSITTTDRTGADGYNPGGGGDYAGGTYTNTFAGTSSATPLASGVAALVLEANPALSWRDLRLVLAASARRNDPTHPDWRLNGAGRFVNHDYGFGVIDAGAAVAVASSWTNVAPLEIFQSTTRSPNLPIPDADATGVTDTLTVSGSGISTIEYVTVEFTATHTFSSDLTVEITSPSGTRSTLARARVLANPPDSYVHWWFGTVRCLDERADGTWTLRVADEVTQDAGTFTSWKLIAYGR